VPPDLIPSRLKSKVLITLRKPALPSLFPRHARVRPARPFSFFSVPEQVAAGPFRQPFSRVSLGLLTVLFVDLGPLPAVSPSDSVRLPDFTPAWTIGSYGDFEGLLSLLPPSVFFLRDSWSFIRSCRTVSASCSHRGFYERLHGRRPFFLLLRLRFLPLEDTMLPVRSFSPLFVRTASAGSFLHLSRGPSLVSWEVSPRPLSPSFFPFLLYEEFLYTLFWSSPSRIFYEVSLSLLELKRLVPLRLRASREKDVLPQNFSSFFCLPPAVVLIFQLLPFCHSFSLQHEREVLRLSDALYPPPSGDFP